MEQGYERAMIKQRRFPLAARRMIITSFCKAKRNSKVSCTTGGMTMKQSRG
jgi:hypothetical protein